MKCNKARELLSDRHNGELDASAEAGLAHHLEGCAPCRQAAQELDEMLQLLGATESPTLPAGFGEAMHDRLMTASQEPVTRDAVSPPPGRPLWASVVRGAGLVAAGAAAVLLVMWISGLPESTPPTKCPAQGQAKGTTTRVQNAGIATRPPDGAQRLRVGQVAVLELSIRAQDHHADARLLVVLPDGVSLLGEGARELEEKRMEWNASLTRGENKIRIPVRARRAGTWRLVARARAAGLDTASEARLVVTRS